ncbi:hypothetical protein H0H81_001412, partial [Sphagnurus paluster]
MSVRLVKVRDSKSLPDLKPRSAAAIERIPMEIWYHILSFIPEHYRRFLRGVNRFLHEIALDEMYKEIRLTTRNATNFVRADRNQILRHRVRHISIQPEFFPETLYPPFIPTVPVRKSRLCFPSFFKKWYARKSRVWKCPYPTPENNLDELEIAGESLAGFSKLKQVNITIYSVDPSPSFSPFLKTLWVTRGHLLQTLSVNLTPEKMAIVLDPTMATELSCLTTFELRFRDSHIPDYRYYNRPIIRSTLLPFAQALRETLTSLTIYPCSQTYLGEFFKAVGNFPELKKLNLGILICEHAYAMEEWEPPMNFVDRHGASVEDLTIHKALPGESTHSPWVHHRFAHHFLPAVRRLCIDVYYMRHGSGISRKARRTPTNPEMLRALHTLVFADVVLDQDKVRENLPISGKFLRRLELTVDYITAKFMNALVATTPQLEELRLQYQYTMEEQSRTPFSTEMEMERVTGYPDWKIRYLRIALHSEKCPEGHASEEWMQLIA